MVPGRQKSTQDLLIFPGVNRAGFGTSRTGAEVLEMIDQLNAAVNKALSRRARTGMARAAL